MKIARIVTPEGHEKFGLFDAGRPDRVEVLEGDLFGAFRPTGRTASIARFLPPVTPPNVYALGLSYGKHAAETGIALPPSPVVFLKAATSVVGAGEAILLPAAGPDQVDYEGELAVIIGKTAKNVPEDEALDYVLGYTCANDVSARDWQIEKQKKQWGRGKSFDTFCPLGPVLVTRDEIADPNRLRLRTLVNGQTLQDAGTDEMIYSVALIVSDLSRSLTLLPGTVILTGTPDGVGFTRKPPIFLRDGDTVTVDIEGIGVLTNPVRLERLPPAQS